MEEKSYKFLFDDAQAHTKVYLDAEKAVRKACSDAITAFVKAEKDYYQLFDILDNEDGDVDFPTVLIEDRHDFNLFSCVKTLYVNKEGKVLLDLEDYDGYPLDGCSTNEIVLLFETISAIEINRILDSIKILCAEGTEQKGGLLRLTTDEVHHIYVDCEGDTVEVPIKEVRCTVGAKVKAIAITEMDDEFDVDTLPYSTVEDLWSILIRNMYEVVSPEENSSV